MTQAPQPIFGFLTYNSRSGSTLLSRLLNDFVDVCVTLEPDLPTELFGAKGGQPLVFNDAGAAISYLQRSWILTKLSTWPVSKDDLCTQLQTLAFPLSGPQLVEWLVLNFRLVTKPHSKLVIYKGPPVMPWEASRIFPWFPKWIWIQILRDPRGVFNSQLKSINPYEQKSFASHPCETAVEWQRGLQTCRSLPSESYREIRFEDLVSDSDRVLDQLLNSISRLSTIKDNAGTQFAGQMPEAEQILHSNIVRKPDLERAHAWQKELTPAQIRVVECVTAPWLESAGYQNVELSSGKNQHCLKLLYTLRYDFRRRRRRLVRILNGICHHPRSYLDKLRARWQIFHREGDTK